MGLIDDTAKTLGRARYAAAQGLRVAWYGANYATARRRSAGFNRPGEPPFKPVHETDLAILRKAWFALFAQDRRNIEEGLYPAPDGVRVRDLPKALRSARAFQSDVSEVDRRRVSRNGVEVRKSVDSADYPAYYRQNFHYQSGGWLSDDSARIYDTQVEALFTGAADAMRRAALAELSRDWQGKDQRKIRHLDLACGTGRFLAETLKAFPRVQATGMDLSPNYAAAAREAVSKWSQADVIEGLAEAIPLDDNSVDSVVSIFLFHELPPKIRPLVIAEIARVLVPGGLFVFADSLQFGDREGLDGFLEYFPEGFHEPYYKGYLSYDFEPVMASAGLVRETTSLAFLTKVMTWRKPA